MPTNIQTVAASDTLDAGRQKFNANDEALKATADANTAQQAQHVTDGHPTLYYTRAQIDAAQTTQDNALVTHKASGDHDARYLSSSLLANLMRLTLDQIIDGIKTFVQNIKVKKAQPAIELQHSDGTPIGNFSGDVVAGKTVVRTQIVEAGNNVKTICEVNEGGTIVDFPNHDVGAKGLKLATEEYVSSKFINGQVSGSFSVQEQLHAANYSIADPIYSKIEGNRKFNGLPNCKLIRVCIHRVITGSIYVGESFELNFDFTLNVSQNQCCFVYVARGIDYGGGTYKPQLKIVRRTYTINAVVDEEIVSTYGGFGSGSTVSSSATDDWFVTLLFQMA